MRGNGLGYKLPIMLTGMVAVMGVLPRWRVWAVRAMTGMATWRSHGGVGGEKVFGGVYEWVELIFR